MLIWNYFLVKPQKNIFQTPDYRTLSQYYLNCIWSNQIKSINIFDPRQISVTFCYGFKTIDYVNTTYKIAFNEIFN